MKNSQFVLIFAAVIFVGATLVSIENELIKTRKELVLIKDQVRFGDAIHGQAEKVPVRKETKVSQTTDETSEKA